MGSNSMSPVSPEGVVKLPVTEPFPDSEQSTIIFAGSPTLAPLPVIPEPLTLTLLISVNSFSTVTSKGAPGTTSSLYFTVILYTPGSGAV